MVQVLPLRVRVRYDGLVLAARRVSGVQECGGRGRTKGVKGLDGEALGFLEVGLVETAMVGEAIGAVHAAHGMIAMHAVHSIHGW